MGNKVAGENLTKCPLCEINGDVGELESAGNRHWVCSRCGHDYKGLDAVLRALNVAKRKTHQLKEEKKRTAGQRTIRVWKEIPAEKEEREQQLFEFAELKCFHCGVTRDKKNASYFIHRANRSVGWVSMDGRYFCPKCYMDHKYELYG